MELTNKSLEALAQLPHLKSLVVQFPEQMQNAYVVGYYSDPEESKRHERKGTLEIPRSSSADFETSRDCPFYEFGEIMFRGKTAFSMFSLRTPT